MNDTTRQVDGAPGVAVLDSILASSYGAAIQPALRSAPPQLARTADDSIGAATTIAAQLGPHGRGLLEAARSAFIQGMGDAVQVGAGVAALAALLVLLFLPARARGRTQSPACRRSSRSRPRKCKDSRADDVLDGGSRPSLRQGWALQTRRKRTRPVLPGRFHPAVRRLGIPYHVTITAGAHDRRE